MAGKTRKPRDYETVVNNIGTLWTIQGAADQLGIQYDALSSYIDRNRIPLKMIGSTRLVEWDDVKNYKPRTKKKENDTDAPRT
jgi:excisionase family DNA binding protein